MRIDRITTLAVMSALLLAGCNKERQVTSEADGCQGCHGGQNGLTGQNLAAPPADLSGKNVPEKVGAHTKHLATGVSCENCHVVPDRTDSAGHIDSETPGRAELTFGNLATDNGKQPAAYDYAALTCSNTYCHAPKTASGISLGGATPTPAWTGAALNCTGCHDYPPLAVAPHSAESTDCSSCHSQSVTDDDLHIREGGLHMNGQANATGGGCTTCHGDSSRPVAGTNQPAPPKDTHGLTSSPQVGAHQIHLEGRTGAGKLAKGFRCEECHVYPRTSQHAITRPEKMTFQGPIGIAAGRVPAYDAASRTCSNTYCHKPAPPNAPATDLGGTNHAPTWDADPTVVACGTCHAAPPPAPHPENDTLGAPITATTQCNQCHPGTVGPDGAVLGDNGLHVNGEINVDFHPQNFTDPAVHGPAANYHDRATFPNGIETCKGCHGADLGGGIVGEAGDCNACHARNGHQNWATSADGCNFCHGSSTGRGDTVKTAMPPADTLGHNANTDRGTGAHLTHLNGRATNAVSDGVDCASCHTSPNYADITHVDGTVELKAELGFQSGPGTCATACHGAGLQGGTNTTPAWTDTSLACTACHGSPPKTGRVGSSGKTLHEQHIAIGWGCTNCHRDVASSNTVINPSTGLSLHVNGAKDVKFWRSTSNTLPNAVWNAADGTCANTCHDTRSWR